MNKIPTWVWIVGGVIALPTILKLLQPTAKAAAQGLNYASRVLATPFGAYVNQPLPPSAVANTVNGGPMGAAPYAGGGLYATTAGGSDTDQTQSGYSWVNRKTTLAF